ncbi:recombinase family protein [Streptomyces spectabilis]|nr:recombinase family protein [Streptomyces spectabilis]MBB5108838.1 hypothetical protein [Streptomyces spectabilis]MCI3899858.1 recombinase family protein [Streptomyces spectabilis]GGV42428.1 hypothetical protein GCM10010245_66560 [Streptomyces spectabilis]
MLIPQLRAELEVRAPTDRGPGHRWERGSRRARGHQEAHESGYHRCRTAQQELQSQLDALEEAGCDPVFSEKASTRVKVRPEFVKAMEFARTVKKAVPDDRLRRAATAALRQARPQPTPASAPSANCRVIMPSSRSSGSA